LNHSHPRQRFVSHYLALAIALALLAGGCRSRQPESILRAVPAGGFVKQWQANINLNRDRITSLHVSSGLVFAYTQSNRVYWMTQAGGELIGSAQVAPPGHTIFPPIPLSDRIVIPTTISIETFDRHGRNIGSYPTKSPIQSPGAKVGDAMFMGVANPGGGRLARFDITPAMLVSPWELYTHGGVQGAPATVGDEVYAATNDGRVWAVSATRVARWPLDESHFKTDGPVTADIAADEYGVYVASQDRKLYCLDRASGKIRWVFYAGTPLVDPPVVIGNWVYQFIPTRGLVAINKSEGKYIREAQWVQTAARSVLSADDVNVYVRGDIGSVVALDKATGLPKFQGGGSMDLAAFALNRDSSLVLAATRDGTIIGMRPVLKFGEVGEVVENTAALQIPLASARQ
jgi:outer membrane protein assembly factor BamB